MDFWIQSIGVVAMVLSVISYQFKSKRSILLCMCAASALFAVNMFMLGAIMGGIMNVLGVARAIAYMNKSLERYFYYRVPCFIRAVVHLDWKRAKRTQFNFRASSHYWNERIDFCIFG